VSLLEARLVTIRHEIAADVAPREALLNRAFGRNRRRKTSERLREGRASALALAACDGQGRLVGTLRLWHVTAGSAGKVLLLGPLAVDLRHRRRGVGTALMVHALAAAAELGAAAILLVGDLPYYGRFGFRAELTTGLQLPGPVDRPRFLGLELVPGALSQATGPVAASGRVLDRVLEAA
jgi:predicted N-acetyltransferase YhbS